jgi:hypothetical protein
MLNAFGIIEVRCICQYAWSNIIKNDFDKKCSIRSEKSVLNHPPLYSDWREYIMVLTSLGETERLWEFKFSSEAEPGHARPVIVSE